MTDSDIIKAMECCTTIGKCTKCPLYKPEITKCVDIVLRRAFDLIKRQQAEIERLEGFATNMEYCANHALDEIEKEKREAIKDFAERLKAKAYRPCDWWPILYVVDAKDIDETVAETERENGRA